MSKKKKISFAVFFLFVVVAYGHSCCLHNDEDNFLRALTSQQRGQLREEAEGW